MPFQLIGKTKLPFPLGWTRRAVLVPLWKEEVCRRDGGMQGRAGVFRFEHGKTVYPKCRFDSDEATFTDLPRNNVSFPMAVEKAAA
jgi:hypothetical protein